MTLGDVVARVSDMLVRPDLTAQIRLCVLDTLREYAREPWHWHEVRNATIQLIPGQQWAGFVSTAAAVSEHLVGPTTLIADVVRFIDVRRLNAGATDLALEFVPMPKFEELRRSTAAGGEPLVYTRNAGEVGFWPVPSVVTQIAVVFMAKPPLPDTDADGSIWFAEAGELIRAAAAARVCEEYIHDIERASVFRLTEERQRVRLAGEYRRKRSTGRLRANA